MAVSYYIYPGLKFSRLNAKQKLHLKKGRQNENHHRILTAICEFYGVSEEKVRSKSRKRELVWCRHVYFFMCSRLTTLGVVKIGNELGLDHTTVLHGRATVQDILDTEPDRIREFDEIENILYKNKYTR